LIETSLEKIEKCFHDFRMRRAHVSELETSVGAAKEEVVAVWFVDGLPRLTGQRMASWTLAPVSFHGAADSGSK